MRSVFKKDKSSEEQRKQIEATKSQTLIITKYPREACLNFERDTYKMIIRPEKRRDREEEIATAT